MKQFKYLLFAFIISLFISSCEENTDSVTNPGTLTLPTEVKISFTDANPNPEVTEGDTTSFRIGMNQAINGRVVISLNVTSSDGVVEATFPTSITLENGQAATYFDFSPDDDGEIESGEAYTITIADVDVQFEDPNTPYYLYNGDYTRTITVRDIPTPIVTTVGDVAAILTWSEPRDLDLWLITGNQDFGGTVIDNSLSISQIETAYFPTTLPDGEHSVYINQYGFTAPVNYTMTFVFPDGQQRAYNSIVTQDSFVFVISKSSSGTNVTYNITEL